MILKNMSLSGKGKTDPSEAGAEKERGDFAPCREESVDWENTENLYIEGDNLEVLKILQSSYYRKVKMIYIDLAVQHGE